MSSPDSLGQVDNIVLVLSGKGGVGKSSITTQLALSLALSGHRVGVLDIDLTGPSIPRFFGIEGRQVHQSSSGWIPVYLDPPTPSPSNASSSTSSTQTTPTGSLCCMSIGFLLKQRTDSVVWRGPKKTAMIRQFLTDVVWDSLDFLLIDTPPGTSDEHISIIEKLQASASHKIRGAVLVTTPQEVSLSDVRKELSFCRKTGVAVLGLIENMSGFMCPCCAEVTNIFSSGGGESMARDNGIKFLGKVPIEPKFVEMIEEQSGQGVVGDGSGEGGEGEGEKGWARRRTLMETYTESPLYGIFKGITADLTSTISG